jgi:hypothetical protein
MVSIVEKDTRTDPKCTRSHYFGDDKTTRGPARDPFRSHCVDDHEGRRRDGAALDQGRRAGAVGPMLASAASRSGIAHGFGARARQADRLRHCAALEPGADHGDRQRGGLARLHGARAGHRRDPHRCVRRRVLARRRHVRVSHGAPAVRREARCRRTGQDPVRTGPRRERDLPECPGGGDPGLRPVRKASRLLLTHVRACSESLAGALELHTLRSPGNCWMRAARSTPSMLWHGRCSEGERRCASPNG